MPTTFFHLTGHDVELTPAERAVLRHYAKRSLLLAGEEDTVVLTDVQKPVELIALLNSLEIGPHPDRVLPSLLELPAQTVIEPFSGAAQVLWSHAAEALCIVDAPPYEVCVQANDKGWFQERFGQIEEARLPPGCVCLSQWIGREALRLQQEHGKAVRVKPVRSASGLHQHVLRPGAPIPATLSAVPNNERYVLQVEMPRSADLSVQMTIAKHGEIFVGPILGQHIAGEGSHTGNFFPASAWGPFSGRMPASICHQIYTAGMQIALGLLESGYFGPASVDFVADFETETVAAVEVNARVSAPRYPIRAAQRWYGEDSHLPFDLYSFRFPKGMSVAQIALHFEGLLFNRERRLGFIPFTVIPEYGVGVGVTFAPSVSDLQALVLEVEARKAALL